MRDLLPFVVVGVTTGAVYGLAAAGLVLTFKTAGVFNFAHGAVAAAGAYVFYELHVVRSVPWPIALVLAVVVFGFVAGTFLELVCRSIEGARPALSVVATTGLLLLVQGLIQQVAGRETRLVPAFLPTTTVRIVGVNVEWGQIITVTGALVLCVALYAYLRRTRGGTAMRAVVDDGTLLALAGTDPVGVRRRAWVIGTALAALTGVLLAPTLGLDSVLLTLLVVQAFGAAALGRFTSLPGAFVGGLVVGIAGALATKFVAGRPQLSGLPPSIPFLILFAVLLVAPGRTLAATSPRRNRPLYRGAPRRRRPWRLTVAGAAVIVTVAAVPSLAGPRIPSFNAAAASVVIFLSLGLLVWVSGQVSLCHAAFVAVGAASMAHLTTGAHLPWAVALLGSGLAVVPLGAFVAVPAIRLSGIYLALATFGFGILMQQVVYRWAVMFGATGTRQVPRPVLLGAPLDDRGYFVCIAAVTTCCCALVAGLLRGRFGRVLRALGDSPTAMLTQGGSPNVVRVLVFCLSAAVAGVGGAMLAGGTGAANGTGLGPFQSLTWLAVLATCGTRLFSSAIAAGAALVLPTAYVAGLDDAVLTIGFGAFALASAGVIDGPGSVRDRLNGWRHASAWRRQRPITMARPPRRAEQPA